MLDTTIIITAFDRPECLDRLLVSIFQYYPDIPIIIVDNGFIEYEPPDLFKHKVGLIRMEPDVGLSACRNKAIEHVKTKYVFVMDDDVIFTDTTKIYNFISIFHEDSIIDIVGGVLYDEDHGKLPGVHKIPGVENIIAQCDIDLEIKGGTLYKYPSPDFLKRTKSGVHYKYVDYVINFFLAKTSLFKEIKWDEDLKLAEHFDFFLRLKNITTGYARRVAFTPDVKADHKNDQREDEEYNEYRSRSKHFFKMSKDKHGLEDVVFLHRDWQHKIIINSSIDWAAPMFIGIGTGRCGTVSLSKIIDGCDGCCVFHEANWQNKQHKFNKPLPWIFDESLAEERISNMKKRATLFSLFGDVAFYYLNYLDYFIENYSNLKIVHIHRDKNLVIDSYLAKTSKEGGIREYDNWTEGATNTDSVWTPCFPQYKVSSKKDGIGLYYSEYIDLTKKYKDRMLEIHVEEINTLEGQIKLFDYLEIPHPCRKYRTVKANVGKINV